MNKVEVIIAGSSYTITGQESRDYLINLANLVNDEINTILDSNVVPAEKINVVASLNIADKFLKSKRDNRLIKKSLEERDIIIEKLKGEIRANRKEIEQKEKEIENYKNLDIKKECDKALEEIIKECENEIKKKDEQLDEAMQITEETFEKFYNLQLRVAKYEIGMKRNLKKKEDKNKKPNIKQIEMSEVDNSNGKKEKEEKSEETVENKEDIKDNLENKSKNVNSNQNKRANFNEKKS